MENVLERLGLFIICFFLSGIGAFIISKYGKALGLSDQPNKRSSHKEVVSKGGGDGILATFVVYSIAIHLPKMFWIPAMSLSLFSFWGDRYEMSPKKRLLFQFAIGAIFLIGVLWEKQNTAILYALIPLLLIYIVGTANYFNFMDGINGIAAVTGIIGFGFLSWFAASDGSDPRIGALCICLSLACLGFLPFNMPKARVFMGDVGSILLGFVFAELVVWLSKSLLDFICLAAFLFPFYADELTTLAVRIKDNDRLTKPHRKHLYQLLANEYRIPHWKVSIAYGVTQLLIGISVMMAKNIGSVMVILMLVVYFCGFAEISWLIRKKLVGRIG